MESNKDDALKCLKFAQKFISAGNKEKALKFLEKSIRLYSTPKAEALLSALQDDTPTCNGSTSEPTTTRQRRKSQSASSQQENKENTSDSSTAGSSTQREYTEEQVKDVLRIKNYQDFYEVLGVGKEFTETELKKAYRKLALQFHPDKNQAPGAAEAFKRIGKAFATLNDADKRCAYDRYGEDLGPSRSRSRYKHEDEFEGDISPEDLFNMFFGGGMPSGRVYVNRRHNNQTHHYHQHNQQNQNVSSMYPIVQILPILLIILFSMLSSLLIPEPVYSFQQTSQYRYRLATSNYGITYFIKDNSLRSKYTSN